MTDIRQALEDADQWCIKRLRSIQAQQEPFHASMALEHPEYRHLLGKHQAFMEMRSYLSGAQKTLLAACLKAKEQADG